jgi:hypothetical protein
MDLTLKKHSLKLNLCRINEIRRFENSGNVSFQFFKQWIRESCNVNMRILKILENKLIYNNRREKKMRKDIDVTGMLKLLMRENVEKYEN